MPMAGCGDSENGVKKILKAIDQNFRASLRTAEERPVAGTGSQGKTRCDHLQRPEGHQGRYGAVPLPGVRPQCSAGLGCWMSSQKYETGVQKTTLLITIC